MLLVEVVPQVLLFLAIAPGVMGMLRWLKARLQGRRGPRAWQPYLDLWKLFHRSPVIPETSSWVFLSAPFIVFGCYLFTGGMVPVVYLPSYDQLLNQPNGPLLADFLVVIALIGLARFAIALAGMDSGSPFGGMGSSREMFVQVLSEPVLLMAAYGLALEARTTSVSGVMLAQNSSVIAAKGGYLQHMAAHFSGPVILFVALALAVVMLAEAGRVPFAHPDSHQELSIARKGIHLEYGGYNLALLEWAEALRVTFFLTLLVNLLFPDTLASAGTPAINWLLILAYPVKLLFMIVLLAWWEVTRARMRLRGGLTPAGVALALSTIAIILAFVWNYS
jgi:formate hydrogenlyase subunit 4